MSNPTTHNTTDGKWRDPYLIGAIARTQAMKLELESDRAGQLYLMTEILTALHRQAEALEAIEDTLYGAILSTRHPLTQTSHERKPFDNPDDPR